MNFRKIACAVLAILLASSQGLAWAQPGPVSSAWEVRAAGGDALAEKIRLHVRAVELGREAQFDTALPILEKLIVQYPLDRQLFLDYLVVLFWAGHYEKAVSLYETKGLKPENMREYDRMAIGRSYFRAGKYKQARILFASVPDNDAARIAEAQAAIMAGAREDGEKIFAALITGGKDLADIYRDRAYVLELIGDYKAAAADKQKMLFLLPDTAEKRILRKQITADVLRNLIRGQQLPAAIEFGKKNLSFMAGDQFFESDFIVALQSNNNLKEAVREADRLWGAKANVPLYGLQAVAESFLRLGNWKQAVDAYERAIQAGGAADILLAGQAIAYAQDGRLEDAKRLYAQLAGKKNAPTTQLLVANLSSLLDYHKPYVAQQLFKTILAELPASERINAELHMGERMLAYWHSHAAYEHFRRVYKIKPDEPRAIAGMIRSARIIGDYVLARRLLDDSERQKIKSPVIEQAANEFKARAKGSLDVAFSHAHSHLDTMSDNLIVAAEHRTSDAVSILAQWRRVELENIATRATATLQGTSAGLGRTWMYDSLRVWYDHNRYGARNLDGFRLSYVRNFGDNIAWYINIAKHPYETVETLPFSLMATDYTLGVVRVYGLDRIRLAYVLSSISDGNRLTGFSAEWQRTWFDKAKTSLNSSLFATQVGFSKQLINGLPLVYYSPERRQIIGFSLSKRWKYGSHYWELTPTFRWERELDGPFLASPSLRLEYGKIYSAYRRLSLGLEYGIFWPHEGGGLKYASLQYYLAYRFGW